jgi:probable phosphoglycerate mutase
VTGAGEPEPSVTRIVLVRHGESQAQVDGIVGGHEGCTGLSARGIGQVELLRDRWLARPLPEIDALYCSVLPRAIQTAEILAPALGDLNVADDCDFCELHPGECDGMTWDEWRERFFTPPRALTPYEPHAPGAETWAELVDRTERALARLVKEHRGKAVVVACHGGVISSSMIACMRLSLDDRTTRFDPVNASITEWLHQEDALRPGPWQLVRYNDHSHLDGLG